MASNESPYAPVEEVVEAVRAGRRRRQPLSGPRQRGALRAALADRYDFPVGAHRRRQRLLRDPAGGRRGAARARQRRGLRLALLLHVSAPGGDHGSGRGCGCRSTPDDDARPRGAAASRSTSARGCCSSATRTTRPAPTCPSAAIGEFLEKVPAARAGDPRRGIHRVPGQRGPGHHPRAAASASRTWSCCAPSRRSTGSRACASATRSAPRTSAWPSTACASRSPSTSSRRWRRRRRPPPGRRRPPRRAQRRRAAVGRRAAGGARASQRRQPGQLLLARPAGTATRPRSCASCAAAAWRCAPATGSAVPGHIRVTYGTRARERALRRGAARDRLDGSIAAAAGHDWTPFPQRATKCGQAWRRRALPSALQAALTRARGGAPSFYFWRFS